MHRDSDKERWKEGKREQESLGNKRMDSAVTRTETNPAEVCDNSVYLPGSKFGEDGNTWLFCLSQGNVFIHLLGVIAGPHRSGCSKLSALSQNGKKIKPKKCPLSNQKVDIRNTKLYTP